MMTSHVHPANIAGKRNGRAFDPCYAPPRRADVGDGVDPTSFDRNSRRVVLEEIGARCCHWPVNDPERGGTFLFCGEATGFGARYCPHHDRRSIGRGTEGERTAHRALQQAAGMTATRRNTATKGAK